MISSKRLLALIKEGESQIVELKRSFQKEVIESVVAFANARGGQVFVGVADDGEIIGLDVQQESIQNWINQIKLSTSPSVLPDIAIETVDSKTNEYLKTKNSSWDYYVDTMQSSDDISLDKIKKFIQRIEANLNKSFDDNPMLVVKKYSLIREDKITFGAYLLFVKDFCLISGVQAGRFKTPTDIIDSISLNTDILTEIDELMIFVRKHLMVEYIITGNPQREERYDYPLDAIREIVLNMIVHRDYRDSSDSVIKIFDDRIEFFNPGDLYDGLTVEQLESNDYESKTRNKLIALMFKECGLMEKYGSGISRIKRLCKEHGIVEPKFEEKQKGFRVTLYKKKIIDKSSSVGVNVGANELYDFIKSNQPVNTRIITEKFNNVTKRTIERWLKQLKDEEKIVFQGSPKTGGYYAK